MFCFVFTRYITTSILEMYNFIHANLRLMHGPFPPLILRLDSRNLKTLFFL